MSLRDSGRGRPFDADWRVEVRKTLRKIYCPVSLAEPSHLPDDRFGKPRGSGGRPLSHNADLHIEASKDSFTIALDGV